MSTEKHSMQSIIVTSTDKKKREQYGLQLCEKENISKFDITTISLEKEEESKQTIGIKQIRDMQKTIAFKPLKGDAKAIIITDAHLLTVEAQNAMLKILEEPPLHTIIILTLPEKDILLPTIRSRCTIVELEKNNTPSSSQDVSLLQKQIGLIPSLSISEKLKMAADIAKNKEETALWIEKSIFAVKEQLLTEIMEKDAVDKKYIELLKSLQWGYLVVSTTNTNPRLLLENLFLSV